MHARLRPGRNLGSLSGCSCTDWADGVSSVYAAKEDFARIFDGVPLGNKFLCEGRPDVWMHDRHSGPGTHKRLVRK